MLFALALLTAGCSRQPSTPTLQSVPTTSAESDGGQTAAAVATNEADEKQAGGIKPLTSEQQDQLLNSRLDGGMDYSFSQFANMFLAMSRIHLEYGVGLMTSSKDIGQTPLQSPFPRSYKPTLREFLDAIALQTFPAEVARLLPCVQPLKVRMLLTTIYASGLRLQEATHLEITDIDSARMQLRVRSGKGAKDRLIPLSPRLLEALRAYARPRRLTRWLFPGARPDRPINPSSVQRLCKQAAAQAGLRKKVTPHTLRHSYATALLEAGIDLPTIQQLLGHCSFSTTRHYLHIRGPRMQSVVSPLDLLPPLPPPATPPSADSTVNLPPTSLAADGSSSAT